MADRKKISETEIKAIVQAEIQSAKRATIVSSERAEALDRYFARPYGNEVTGRSQVVATSIRDAVEWIKPTALRILFGGENVVSFSPQDEGDVEFAKQATKYVNYVWNCDNHGFLNGYTWVTDGLISKNGTLKIYWDDTPKQKRQSYSGLDKDLYAETVAPDDITVSEHTENDDGTHDVVTTKTIQSGKVCIIPVAPENFLISDDGRNIEDAGLVGDQKLVTLSDLRKEGISETKLQEIAAGGYANATSTGSTDQEEIARNTVEELPQANSEQVNNEAMRQVWRIECYIKIDVDGDGIAEMRKIVAAGPGYTIISNEPWKGPRPYATLTPIILPHRFYGLSIADLIKDIQLIQTTLFRQLLDNMYLSNNQREEVVASRIIEPDELLSSAPGRKIRVKDGNGPAITPIVVPQIGPAIIEAMQYLDTVEEDRTGVSQRTQGIGANQLHDTAAGEKMLMSAAMGKIELMVRVMAETGLRDAAKLILKLLVMYQKKPRRIELPDGWADMDPGQWNADMEVKTSVGIGTGDRDHQLMASQMVGKVQQMLLPLGFVSPENIKNATDDGLQAFGKQGVDRYFTFPQGDAAKQPIKLPPPGQKPGPDPQVEMAKAQAAAQAKVQVAQITAQARAATDTHQNQMELQRHTMENRQEMELARFKAQMEAQIELAIAHIKADAQIETARVTAEADAGDDDVAYHRARESA